MDTYSNPRAGRICIFPQQKRKHRDGATRKQRRNEQKKWRNHDEIERQNRLIRRERLMEMENFDE